MRVALVLVVTALLAACPRQPRREPPPAPARPGPVDAGVSDVATGGSWEAGGTSGVYRVVVRGGGRRSLRSDVALQWLRWDAGKDEPVLVKSVPVTEFAQGGVLVTASRIDQEEGRTVVRLSLANAVTGTIGEARIWPEAPGLYRARLKWFGEYD
jgi:hypothetical protein